MVRITRRDVVEIAVRRAIVEWVEELEREGVPDPLTEPMAPAAVIAGLLERLGADLPAWLVERLDAPAA